MTWTFDKHLHILLPRTQAEFAHNLEFAQLSLVVGIVGAAGTHSVANADSHIVVGKNVADFIPVRVKEVFLVVVAHPLCHNASATRYAACETPVQCWQQMLEQTCVDSKVVNALLALLDKRVAVHFPSEFVCLAVYLLKCLIHRNSTHRNRTVADYPFACLVDVLAS